MYGQSYIVIEIACTDIYIARSAKIKKVIVD